MANNASALKLRKVRVRKALARRENGRPRLSVFRSSKNIYAQIIDDVKGVTVASASTLEEGFVKAKKTGADKAAAETIGKLIAERARQVCAEIAHPLFPPSVRPRLAFENGRAFKIRDPDLSSRLHHVAVGYYVVYNKKIRHTLQYN